MDYVLWRRSFSERAIGRIIDLHGVTTVPVVPGL
jgi:hypothetical protein